MTEPQRLGEILPRVIKNIKRRCESNPDNRDFKPEHSEHKDKLLRLTLEKQGR